MVACIEGKEKKQVSEAGRLAVVSCVRPAFKQNGRF